MKSPTRLQTRDRFLDWRRCGGIDLRHVVSFAADQLRRGTGIVVNQSNVGLIQKPRQLLERAFPSRADFVFGNGMAAHKDAQSDALDVHIGGIEQYIKKADFETEGLGQTHEPSIFWRGQDRFHANGLVGSDRSLEPRLY